MKELCGYFFVLFPPEHFKFYSVSRGLTRWCNGDPPEEPSLLAQLAWAMVDTNLEVWGKPAL